MTPAPVWRLPTLWVLAAAVFAAITTEVLPVGLLPQISNRLGVSESRSGLLVSAYAVVVAAAAIPLTAVVGRWPRRAVLAVLLAGYAASNVLFAATHTYGVALGARVLGGLAHAGLFSVVIAAAVDVVPPSRAGRAVAFVSAGNVVGLALGVPLGTALGSAVGLRATFAAAAALTAVLAVLTRLVLPRGIPPATTAADPVLSAVRRGPLLTVALTVAVLTLGHYTLYTYIAPVLLSAGVAAGAVSVVLFGYGAAGVLGLALAGLVVDRRPARGLQGAVALTALCVLAVGLTRASTAATVTAVVVWGAAFGALPTLLMTAALKAAPQSPDAAPAVVNTTFNIGIAGGGVLGAHELTAGGPPLLAVTGAALIAVALALLVVGPAAAGRRRRR